jgi:hypothetical protein
MVTLNIVETPATSGGGGQTKIVYDTDNIINQMLQFFPKEYSSIQSTDQTSDHW